MTFKYFLVAVLIGFIFYLLLLPRLDTLRKGVIFLVVLTMLVFVIQPDWSTAWRIRSASRAASTCCSTCRT